MHGELLQASTRFYPRFTLPRVRSRGFGSYAGDSWRFHTTPLVNCGLLVSLRLPDFRRLALPHTYTPWHVIQNGRCTTEAAHLSITKRFHALWTLCEEYFSAFPHGTSFAIGLATYLGLEVVVPQLHTPFPRRAIQDTSTPALPPSTGLSPSLALRSSRLCLEKDGLKKGPATPHPLHLSAQDSVCPRAAFGRSYLQHPNWFLFLRVLRCFSSPRWLSLRTGREVSFGDPGFNPYVRVPRA